MRHFRYIALIAIAFLIPSSVFAQTLEATTSLEPAATGNAVLANGDADSVTIVAFSVEPDGTIGFVLQNTTADLIYDVEVRFTILDDSGNLLASGESVDLRPSIIGPGEFAIGRVTDINLEDPDEAELYRISVDFNSDPDEITEYPIDFTDSEAADGYIRGTVSNPNRTPIGTIHLAYACFDDRGVMTERGWGIEPGTLNRGEETMFQINDVGSCETYLVTGYGTED